jgi:hypothetical protein
MKGMAVVPVNARRFINHDPNYKYTKHLRGMGCTNTVISQWCPTLQRFHHTDFLLIFSSGSSLYMKNELHFF